MNRIFVCIIVGILLSMGGTVVFSHTENGTPDNTRGRAESEMVIIWNKTWGGSGDEEGFGVAIDSSGNVYVTGTTKNFGAGRDDAVLLKYGSDGV